MQLKDADKIKEAIRNSDDFVGGSDDIIKVIDSVPEEVISTDTDTISRQRAITAIDNCGCDGEDSCGQQWIYKENAVETIEMVEPLPPAQPKIIHCKECRHRDEFGCCKYWVGLTMGMPTTATDDDDFCSHAERIRTEATE